MDEADGLPVLHDANAVEAVVMRLPPMVGAMKIIRSVGRKKQHMAAVRDPPPVFLESAHAEQIAADCCRRQQAEKHLAVEIVGLAERHLWRHVSRARLGESGRDLAGSDRRRATEPCAINS